MTFDEFCKAHYNDLLYICAGILKRSPGDPDVEDLCHHAMIKMQKVWDRPFRGTARLSWASTICRNQWIDWERSGRRRYGILVRNDSLESWSQQYSMDPMPLGSNKMFDELDDLELSICYLRALGYTYPEISDITGWSLYVVYYRYQGIMEKLSSSADL